MAPKTVEIVPGSAGLSGYCAETGAAILCAHLLLPPDHICDHAAYIEHWMRILRSDKRAFLHAAAQAQLAVDWLLSKSPAPEASDVQA